ncbi:MAG: plasmid pRiA4b ORF-3 family protein [Desulfobacterales bacterium]
MDIDPPIWRYFVVPAGITLDRLRCHQIVMGWTDSHLYQFSIGKRRYAENVRSKLDGLESGNATASTTWSKRRPKFSYLYDFGDNWLHYLTLEDNRYSIENLRMVPGWGAGLPARGCRWSNGV